MATTKLASVYDSKAPEANQDQQFIERITRLAALASEREAIDPMLDTLRVITAKIQPGQTLTLENRQSLTELEHKLTDYLIHDDPLRAFTKESLAKRLREPEENIVARHRLHLFIALMLSVGFALLPVLVPPYSGLASRIIIFSPPLFFLGLAISTSWFYLTSLANFKPELRKAFILLCIGIITYGVFFSHYAIIQAFDLGKQPLFKYGGILSIVAVAWSFMYLGLRAYARLLRIKTLFTSLWVWLGLVFVAIVAAVVLPHSSKVTEERFFEFALSGLTVLGVTTICGAFVSRSIMRSVTAAYTKSIFWLYLYQVLGLFSNIGAIVIMLIVGPLTGATLSMAILICGFGPLLLLLYTGYSFKKETSQ